MSTYITIWVVAFMLNGDPAPFTQILKDGDTCSDSYATELVHEIAQRNNIAFQELVLWRCETFTSPGPAAPIEQEDEQPVRKRNS